MSSATALRALAPALAGNPVSGAAGPVATGLATGLTAGVDALSSTRAYEPAELHAAVTSPAETAAKTPARRRLRPAGHGPGTLASGLLIGRIRTVPAGLRCLALVARYPDRAERQRPGFAGIAHTHLERRPRAAGIGERAAGVRARGGRGRTRLGRPGAALGLRRGPRLGRLGRAGRPGLLRRGERRYQDRSEHGRAQPVKPPQALGHFGLPGLADFHGDER